MYYFKCACKINFNSYSEWFNYHNCKYCFCFNGNKLNHFRIKLNDKQSIWSDYDSYYTIDEFKFPYFEPFKFYQLDFKIKSKKQVLDYLIRLSDNLIFM